MQTIKINYTLIFRICAIIGIIVFAYFFPNIIYYLFLAFILMLIGNPLATSICKIKVFNRHISRTISTVITIIVFIIVLLVSLFFFVPSLIRELRVFEGFDYATLLANLNVFLDNIQNFLYNKNLLDKDQTLIGLLENGIIQGIDIGSISTTLGGIVSSTGSFFFGLFSVFFIAFFFIKDDMRVENFLKIFVNKDYVGHLTQVIEQINHLLSRYLIGTLIKTFIMIVLLYIGFLLFGIRGALLMAFIGGITNIIPYLGPFIGWGIVCVFGLTTSIGNEMYSDILPMLVKVSIMFILANTIESLVLTPVIYSLSIKAHPIEVFLVTIIGGQVAGIGGMILGIPVYTIIRIVIIEIYTFVTKKDKELLPPGKT